MSNSNLIKASAVCKCFYHLSRKNSEFAKKLTDSRALFSGANTYEQYREVCLSLAEQISHGLKKNFDDEDLFLRAKDVIFNNLLFDILPF